MPTGAAPSDWIGTHRDRWVRKASLRRVYAEWFRQLRAHCLPGLPIVELGCGPGFFKEMHPDVLATDVRPNPYADRVVDAEALPFADREVGSIVMVDVFHHLLKPERFLREVARTLRPAGRLILLEPWISVVGRLFYRYVHHESCDLAVDVAAPWAAGRKDPMEGNSALPYLYFRPGGHLERMGLPLRVTRRQQFAGLPWLLTGGFQPFNLLPAFMVRVAEKADGILSLVPSLTATRCLLVVEKTSEATSQNDAIGSNGHHR